MRTLSPLLVLKPKVSVVGKYIPLVGAADPDGIKFVPPTERPAVKLATDTCLVVAL
jgi:hypothetical protein